MTCSVCGGKGIVRCADPDNPDSPVWFAVCLCPASAWYRREQDGRGRSIAQAGWQVWAARERVNPDDVFMLEEAFTEDELAEMGFRQQTKRPAAGGLAAVGKSRGRL